MSTKYQDTVFTNGAIHALRCFFNNIEHLESRPISCQLRDMALRVVNTMPMIDERGYFEFEEVTRLYRFRYHEPEKIIENG